MNRGRFVPAVCRATLGAFVPWRPLRWPALLQRISDLAAPLARVPDDELRRRSLSLRYRADSGESLDRLLPEAYALMREAAARAVRMRHYDVQILGGIAMHHRAVAEMLTGEGKTLAATLPVYLSALVGRGAHLATANDYLAERDGDLMRPAYALLGLTVGVVHSSSSRPERRRSYECDVTYAAARELGFDFLRDRLQAAREAGGQSGLPGRMSAQPGRTTARQKIQRELYFALVDEADSILIDEARTPLIVSSLPGESEQAAASLHAWAASVAGQFQQYRDYDYDHKRRAVTLNVVGRRRLRELDRPDWLARVGMFDLYEHLEQAICAARDFHREQHYIVRNGEIVIVDENTGRLAEGRKWRDGLHQAIEAKEGLEVTAKTVEAARITVQDFFLLYQRLAGMTGTAWSSRREFKRIYELGTYVIPANRPEQRVRLPDLVFGDTPAKLQAVVREVSQMHTVGRPVLIGTRSIDKSEHLSKLLSEAGIEHQVLNARRHAEEAAIVARAGQLGKVTVATNMAGRGTDIKLGPGVAELGGLHVIGTELHESARIDRQLVGRCARQGDPGSSRQFLALDDEIVRTAFGPEAAERLRKQGAGSAKQFNHLAARLRRAQKRVQRKQFRQRRLLMYHERQRCKAQLEMGQDPYLDAAM